MRTLQQPGAALEPRRLVARGEVGEELRVVLREGSDLLTGLAEVLAARGIADAAVQLTGGGFSSLQYLTGQPDASGRRIATYGPPTALEGPVMLVGGNAILGRDAAGRPLLHCHAVVVDREGRVHGGHLPAGVCIAGPEGVVCHVAALTGVGFRVGEDSETNYSIFHPAEA